MFALERGKRWRRDTNRKRIQRSASLDKKTHWVEVFGLKYSHKDILL